MKPQQALDENTIFHFQAENTKEETFQQKSVQLSEKSFIENIRSAFQLRRPRTSRCVGSISPPSGGSKCNSSSVAMVTRSGTRVRVLTVFLIPGSHRRA